MSLKTRSEPDVVDRDLGWNAAIDRIIEAEGMQVRAGILSGIPKYPKSGAGKKGSQVAKVGAVHGFVKGFGNVFDRVQGDIAVLLDGAHGQILAGRSAAQALEPIGRYLRDAFRREVKDRGFVKSGRLLSAVRGAVFDGAKRVAGDDPRRPRATDAVDVNVPTGSASVFAYLR